MRAKRLAALCNLDASSLLLNKPRLGRSKGSSDNLIVGDSSCQVDELKVGSNRKPFLPY